MNRKLIYIIIGIAIIMIGVVIYFSIQKINQITNPILQNGALPSISLTNTNGIQQNNSSTINNSSTTYILNKISNQQVLDYFINKDSSIIIINSAGNIILIKGGVENIISSLGIQNIIKASFSYDGLKLFVTFGDINNPQTSVFDINKQSWTPLISGILSPTWSPDNYKIAYLIDNGNFTETLNIVSLLGKSPITSKITTLHIKDLSLNWVTDNFILFSDKPSVYTFSSMWSFNLTNKTFNQIISQQRGLEVLWNNDISSTFIGMNFISDPSQIGGTINLINKNGNETALNFLTLPSKCAFNEYTENNQNIITNISTTNQSTTISTTTKTNSNNITSSTTNSYPALYCAVPRDQSNFTSYTLPDNYDQMAVFTSDNIYRINISNGNVYTLFSDQTKNLDISQIKIFNNNLFFINRLNQNLYSLLLN